jgi:NAD(P)-dependent dehydrogenase (short-subunit alcohol dehydrogenase family)
LGSVGARQFCGSNRRQLRRYHESTRISIAQGSLGADDYGAAGKRILFAAFFCCNPGRYQKGFKMEKTLAGKVALVTGASRGIGKAICLALAKEGSAVVLAARSMDKLTEAAEQMSTVGARAEVMVTDLAEEASIKHLVEVTNVKFGRLDILVNNAGVTHSAELEQTKTADWDRCFQINARAPFILCREAIPLLRKSEAAYIINIASIVGVRCYPLQSAYTASKHALRGMTMSLAEELNGSNIRVHLVCPGGVDTDLVKEVRPDIEKDKLMKPEEIAELVVYLVTHKGNAVIDELHVRRAASVPWF